jgi:ESS family glutamate:Na+ symporter
LQRPLLSAFFTSIGFRVSVALLRRGGGTLLVLLVLGTLGAVLQNAVGIGMAVLLGQPPLFGVLCGSVTLTGGPATGLAFAPQFESAGVPGAEAVAIVAAIFGIVAGGLISAPIATVLVEKYHRRSSASDKPSKMLTEDDQLLSPDSADSIKIANAMGVYAMHKSLAILLVAMWLGSWLSAWLTAYVMTLPVYMGGMLVAAAIRNLDDATGYFGLSDRTLEVIGDVALSFFLVLALMTVELWKLSAIALPMLVILSLQVVLMVAYSVSPIYASMGRDYDASVIAGGFFGFMIGITANAMASMDSLVRRYGPAPLAYLVVPVVGAFFIDFTNALIIQACLNLFT